MGVIIDNELCLEPEIENIKQILLLFSREMNQKCLCVCFTALLTTYFCSSDQPPSLKSMGSNIE